MTITNTIDEFTGTSPNRSQPAEDFETNVGDFLPWMEGLAVDLNTTIGEINSTATDVNSDASAANTAATTATEQADLAEEWATSNTLVESLDYSAKEYAIGTTVPAGSAKDWASQTGTTVDGSEYSAKEYATGTAVATGSAKEWSTSLTEVADGLSGARYYAEQASASAATAGADFTATSATNTLIGLGSKTFAIETGKAFVEGQVLRIVSDADVNNYMVGQITDASDGSITVDVTAFGGSGTFADWVISIYQVSKAELDSKASLSGADFTGRVSGKKVVVASSGGTLTLDCSLGNHFVHTLTESTTIALTNLPSTDSALMLVITIIQDSLASGYTVTWPAGSLYETATAPSLSTTADARDLVVLRVLDGSTIEVNKAKTGYGVV